MEKPVNQPTLFCARTSSFFRPLFVLLSMHSSSSSSGSGSIAPLDTYRNRLFFHNIQKLSIYYLNFHPLELYPFAFRLYATRTSSTWTRKFIENDHIVESIHKFNVFNRNFITIQSNLRYLALSIEKTMD